MKTMDSSADVRAAKPPANRDALLPDTKFRPPRTPGERQLAPIWRAALNLDRIGADDDFFALGGESMAATLICAEVERLTGRRVATNLFLDAPTVAAFAIAFDGDMRDLAERSLMQIRPGTDRPPLVMIHGLDGQIMFVRRLAWALPVEQPIYAIQARGLDGRTKPHDDAGELIEDYAQQILAAFGRREIFLGGFCFGCVVAVAVLHRLRALGVECRHLAMIDPPPEARFRRQQRPEELRRTLMTEWYDTLGERLASATQWHPELAQHYGPGGDGLRQAQAVMRSLLRAYNRLKPAPTDTPATVIWSQERFQERGGTDIKYGLVTGPYTRHVIHSKKRLVTHVLLLKEGMGTIAAAMCPSLGIVAKQLSINPADATQQAEGTW